jgi:hypothetical protein
MAHSDHVAGGGGNPEDREGFSTPLSTQKMKEATFLPPPQNWPPNPVSAPGQKGVVYPSQPGVSRNGAKKEEGGEQLGLSAPVCPLSPLCILSSSLAFPSPANTALPSRRYLAGL